MDAVSGQAHAAAADTALHRLATYGTLRPGHLNDHQLDGLQGRWLEGYVNGRLVDEGWGASKAPGSDPRLRGLDHPCSCLPVGRPSGPLVAPRRLRGTRLFTSHNDGPDVSGRPRLVHLRSQSAASGWLLSVPNQVGTEWSFASESSGVHAQVSFAQLPMLGSHAPNALPGSAPELPR